MLDILTLAVLQWIQQRKAHRRRKIVTDGMKELHALTVTMHGRFMLGEACLDEENGLDPEIRRMYWILLQMAPVSDWAEMN